MIDAAELAVLLVRQGPQPAGVLGGEDTAGAAAETTARRPAGASPTPRGQDHEPAGEPAAAPALVQAADDLAAGWSARLALARTQPRQRAGQETSLVLSLREVLVLAERVVAGVRHRTVLHTDHLPAFLRSSTATPFGTDEPGILLPDLELDPTAVAAGRWPPDIGAVVESAHLVFEAVLATAYEGGRDTRPMITGLVCDVGIVNLIARPAQQSLRFCHRDAAGTAQLLADLLLQG